MKKTFFLATLLLTAMFALAQSITVKFTAEDQNGDFFQLDVVEVTNVSQNWSQALAYPDTVLVLNYIDGISQQSYDDGLLQNGPNPFHGSTEATLTLTEDEQAVVRLFDMKGAVLAECAANLIQGENIIKVCVAEPQMALLQVSTTKRSYVVKLLNISGGGDNRIEIACFPEKDAKSTKAVGAGPFAFGDVMKYVGIKIDGTETVPSGNTVTQQQFTDDVVTFVFYVEQPDETQPPVVVTGEVSDVTTDSAICGGEVVSDGGAEVTERGVCWSTTPEPSISDSRTNDGVGTGTFASSMTELTDNTVYYVRAYATNGKGTGYGEEKSFVTQKVAPTGGIQALFSVSKNTKVWFSQGNLQYQASTNTWRFAERQWDFVGSQNPLSGNASGTVSGSDNSNISSTYSGWIDLFGWGTGGNPTNASAYNDDYSTYAEWGGNPISNGGDSANMWRSLTYEEWNYLLFVRTGSYMRFAKATVNGLIGLIILPDYWDSSCYALGSVNLVDASFDDNTITADDWTNVLEAHGAVFLPAACRRDGVSVYNGGTGGDYWTSSPGNSYYANRLFFGMETVSLDYWNRYVGRSVRLVAEERLIVPMKMVGCDVPK